MSFSVNEPRTGLEYNGNSINSLFAQRSNLFSPGFIGMVRDILRFNREALGDLESGRIHADTTLGEYLRAKGYGQRFTDHYIIPMGAAIWSMSLADMLAFPLAFFVRFFKNHGLLSVNDRPQWRVITGGSRSYIAPLIEPFKDWLCRQRCRLAYRYPPVAAAQTGLGQLELSPGQRYPGQRCSDLQHEHPAGHGLGHHLLRQPQPDRRD